MAASPRSDLQQPLLPGGNIEGTSLQAVDKQDAWQSAAASGRCDSNDLDISRESSTSEALRLENPVREVETVRDIQRDKAKKNKLRPVSSAPSFSDLLHPELSRDSFTKPGGFRRQFVASQREIPIHEIPPFTATTSHGFLNSLGKGMLIYDEDNLPEAPDDQRLAGIPSTLLTIFKSFVGTAILFQPAGFKQAGALAAAASLLLAGVLSMLCASMLIESKQALVRRGETVLSYGDIASFAFGAAGRTAVDVSIFLSQFGFSCSYASFVVLNVRHFLENCFPASWVVADKYKFSILGAFVIWTPLCFIRNVQWFALPSLVANVIIFCSIVYIMGSNLVTIHDNGIHKNVEMFQPSFLVFFGTAAYSFEGIGLVVPIERAMREKEKLPMLLRWSFVLIISLLIGFGLVGT